jgi:hypothetical protein
MLTILIRVLRVISLAILSAGSVGFVLAAMAGVKSAQEHGITVSQAATANAPVFAQYGNGILVLTIFLVFVELLDYLMDRKVDRARLFRYGTSVACLLSAVIFAKVLVPQMEELLPNIGGNEEAHAAFQQLHNLSRIVVGALVLFSLASIAIPLAHAIYELRFEENEEQAQAQTGGKDGSAEKSDRPTEQPPQEGADSS